MMTGRHHERLSAWITAGERDDLPCLHAFTFGGIRREQPAVANGLTLVYGSGTVEGTICRVILWNAPPWQSTESMFGGNPRRWRPRPSCGLVPLRFHRT
jgi:hypothetical protein